MTDKKTILQIEGPVASVLPGQIACEVAEDADTGARMWGGKDHAGNVSKFLVKDGIAVIKKVVGEGGLTLESEHGSVDVTEAGESALATRAQSIVGAINELNAKASAGSEALVFRSGVDLNSNNDYEASLPLPLLETGYWEIFSFRVGVSDDANLGWAVADSRWGIEDPYRYLDSLVLLIDDEAAVPYFSARGEYESLGMDSTGTRANRRPVIMRVEEGSEMALTIRSESKDVHIDFTLLARKIGDLPDPLVED